MFLEFRETRRLYDIFTVLGVSSRHKKMVCPLPQHVHHQNTPSFSVFTTGDGVQVWKCHGNCNLQGDVIDLVGYLKLPNYNCKNGEHVRMATGLLSGTFEIEPPKPVKRTTISPQTWMKYFPAGKDVFDYAARRGLSPSTLEKFKVGQYKHFMSIPTFEDGILQGIKFRNTWPPEKLNNTLDGTRFWASKGSRKAVFNYDAVAYNSSPALILKGEIPVMLCDQHNILACAPTGGESAGVEQYVAPLSFSRKLVVVGDNDRDPQVREVTMASARKRAVVLKAEVRFPPAEFKDIDDWILADIEALSVIRKWIEVEDE